MWIHRRRAQKAKLVEQVCNPDLDIVGIQESGEKEGGGIGCKVGGYAWIGENLG